MNSFCQQECCGVHAAPGMDSERAKARPAAASSELARQKSRTASSGAARGKRRCARRPSGKRTARPQPPASPAPGSGGSRSSASLDTSAALCAQGVRSISQSHLLQPPRADQISDPDRHSQHPTSHQYNHKIILPKYLHPIPTCSEQLSSPGYEFRQYS